MATSAEDRLTNWLRKRVAQRGPDLLGDDAAFIAGEDLAITVDQQIAGVHFREGLGPEVVGRRLVAVNMSDVAAVGGEPAFGFAALAAPRGYPARRFLSAVEEALAGQGARLAGGDIAASGTFVASLTLVARRRPRARWVRRSAASPGDRLWLGGSVGDSALGRLLIASGAQLRGKGARLPARFDTTAAVARAARNAIRRHLSPPNQLALGAWLSRRRRAAAIDISDGLLLDLARLCRASGVGAAVQAADLPLIDSFGEAAALVEADAVELALSGGEDYVLLFALPPTISPPLEYEARPIGEIRQRPGVAVLGAKPPSRGGWDHLDNR